MTRHSRTLRAALAAAVLFGQLAMPAPLVGAARQATLDGHGPADRHAAAGTVPSHMPSVEDVTAITGYQVTGPVTSWNTTSGGDTVEHIAGRTPEGRLIVFWRSPRTATWEAVDVTAKTGVTIAGQVTSYVASEGAYKVEHLAARSPAGDLIDFAWSPAQDWTAANVSLETGVKVADSVAAHAIPGTLSSIYRMAARTPQNELILFTRSARARWMAVNLTAKFGWRIDSGVVGWRRSNRGAVTEYFAARHVAGTLFVFAVRPDGTYQSVTSSRGPGKSIQRDLVAWQTGQVDHVAAQAPDGSLLVFYTTTGMTSWKFVDVTRITGERVQGASSVHQLKDGAENVEILGSRNPDGKLLLHWWKPSRDWQSLNLSEITGYDVSAPPTAWETADDGRIVEHFAAAGTEQQLLVFSDFAKPRYLTDALGRQLQSVKRTRNVRRKVVTVLWDPANPAHPAPDTSKVGDKLFGETGSVRGYYLENSNGAFTIENAGVFGWYRADKNWEHYWDNPGAGTRWDYHHAKYEDGWLNGHYEKWTEAIRKLDPEFDFAAFDANGDEVLGTDELAVLIVIPAQNPFGTNRVPAARQAVSASGRTVKVDEPLVVDGVRIPWIAEWYTGNSGFPNYDVNLGAPAHELAHLLLGLPDMYFWFPYPHAAGDYSLMDRAYESTHLDPAAKLKLGWLRPKILFREGSYDLADVESSHTVWILMDPARGPDEYFIVENRFRGNSQYDVDIDDEGFAVWHVVENPAVYGALPPPPGVSAATWAQVGAGDWGRRAIRMLRSVSTPFDDGRALYDGSDPATGYDLLSSDPKTPHSELRWADGTPSGFALRNISAAGATMHADVTVP